MNNKKSLTWSFESDFFCERRVIEGMRFFIAYFLFYYEENCVFARVKIEKKKNIFVIVVFW